MEDDPAFGLDYPGDDRSGESMARLDSNREEVKAMIDVARKEAGGPLVLPNCRESDG